MYGLVGTLQKPEEQVEPTAWPGLLPGLFEAGHAFFAMMPCAVRVFFDKILNRSKFAEVHPNTQIVTAYQQGSSRRQTAYRMLHLLPTTV